MQILIETKYTLFGEEGDMFNEVSVHTEVDCNNINDFESLVDMHTEKEADRERIIRTQLKDLLNDKLADNEI